MRRTAGVALAFGAVAAFTLHGGRGKVFDDPFILYRYARNLASGQGWTFNAGLRDGAGVTSPLYVVVLAVLYKCGLPMQTAAAGVFALGLTVCATSTYVIFDRVGKPVVGLVAGILVVTNPWITAVRGMETGLFLGVLGVALLLYIAERPLAAGLAFALLCVVRPDGALYAAGAIGWELFHHRRLAALIPLVGPLVAVLTLWAGYAEIAMGQVVPDTLHAKEAQTRSGYFGHGHLFIRGFLDAPRNYDFRAWVLILYLAALLGAAALIWSHRDQPSRFLVPLLAGDLLLVGAYGLVFNVPYQYLWYYVPIIYGLCVLAAIAADELARVIDRHLAHAGSGVVLIGAAGAAIIGTRYPLVLVARSSYEPAADWVAANSTPRQTLAADEIGLVGWYSHRRIVDYVGLLSTRTADEFQARHATWWIREFQPDFWMVYQGGPQPNGVKGAGYPWDVAVLRQPWFPGAYRVAYQNSVVIIYKKSGSIPPASADRPT